MTTNQDKLALSHEHVFDIRLNFDKRWTVGPIPGGDRFGYTSLGAGSTVSGPRLNGRIVDYSGADWPMMRQDGVVELNAHYMMEADDGTLIYIRNLGYVHGRNDVRAADESPWRRRLHRQHGVHGELSVRAPAGYLQYDQICRSRPQRVAPLQPRAPRDRGVGSVARLGEKPHPRQRGDPAPFAQGRSKAGQPRDVDRLEQLHQTGMEPDLIARRTLDAIAEGRFHIFPHPEFRDELRELFDEILADFRDYPEDPGYMERLAFERGRRASYKAARLAARQIG